MMSQSRLWNVMPDHVHMVISFKPKYAAADVVKALKGGSARLFFKNHLEIKNSNLWGIYGHTAIMYEYTRQYEP